MHIDGNSAMEKQGLEKANGSSCIIHGKETVGEQHAENCEAVFWMPQPFNGGASITTQ